MTSQTVDDSLILSDAPAIPGLRFRRCRGAADYPAMYEVDLIAREADGREVWETAEQFAKRYSTLKNFDPWQDSVIAEVDGQMVGFNRVEWWDESERPLRHYFHIGFVLPQWRGQGIGRAQIRRAEARARALAAGHPPDRDKQLQTEAVQTQTAYVALLDAEGYQPMRYSYEMTRPIGDPIPDLPLPAGVEVRPVRPEQYRTIWDGEVEAFRDHWGSDVVDEQDYQNWLDAPDFQPHLWLVAWAGAEMVGKVGNYINETENARYQRKRGYTEDISVRRPWRRQGVARALLARSIALHRDLGMAETALSVDTENPNGARQLYEDLGYRVIRTEIEYWKPLA